MSKNIQVCNKQPALLIAFYEINDFNFKP